MYFINLIKNENALYIKLKYFSFIILNFVLI